MSVFKTARQISAGDAARRLGIQERHNRFLCPFHDDHDPSMACYANTGLFYCFSCHAKGDATTLWAKVKDMSMLEAARDLCAAYNLTPEEDARVKWLPPRQRAEEARKREEEARRKQRIDLVAILPDLVLEAWRDGAVCVLGTAMDACEKLFEISPDPNGWMWQMAFRRMSALHDEMNRLKAIPVRELAAEAADRRAAPHGGALLPGQPEFSDRLLRDILAALLEKKELQLTPEERAYVYRTLQIGQADVPAGQEE